MTDTPNPLDRNRFVPSVLILSFLAGCASPASAAAQEESVTRMYREIERLQLQIMEVKRESQYKLKVLQRQTELQLHALQMQIAELTVAAELSASTPLIFPAPNRSSDTSPHDFSKQMDISGDFRLRYEYNSSYAEISSWARGVMRGRLAAVYALNGNFKLGGRLVTGDPGNPRTADVTIGDFASDFELSLDQAYMSFESEDLFLTGGKFAKPFRSTELVWDGDVNPQGVGGHYKLLGNDAWSARLSGTYFIIDQSIFEHGSDMTSGQFSLDFQPGSNWQLTLDAAYYDYDIGALDPDVPGGARGNNVTPDGRYYVSDFNLLDTIGTVTYKGFGNRWDVRFVGDCVKNLGAVVPEDTGYGFDLLVGNLQQKGHFLFRYGYSRVETDAVLGMFSNDNIIYPTNYELHSFSADYALHEHAFVGLTGYLYRRADPDIELGWSTNDWLSRTRLNFYFTF